MRASRPKTLAGWGGGFRAQRTATRAAGLAGLLKLRDQLAGKSVAIVLSGANVATPTLRRVLNREL